MTYASSGTWAQHNLNGSLIVPAIYSSGNWSDTAGETQGGNSAGGQYAVDATTSGTVYATLTWVPATGMTMAQDPPPDYVILTETATSYAGGGINNGQDDTWSDGIGVNNTDTRYSVATASAGVIYRSDNLSASTPTAPGPPYAGNRADVSVSYTVAAGTVEVDLAGVTRDGDNLDILTGQQVVATLVAPYTVSNLHWSTAAGDAFENYDPYIALTPGTPNQLASLTALDMQQPGFSFYTKSAGDATVKCTMDVTCPDGTVLNVEGSRKLQSLKPGAAVTMNPAGTPKASGIGMNYPVGSSPYLQASDWWWPATITVPAPFTGGGGGFAQLWSAGVTNTRTPLNNASATFVTEIPDDEGWQPMPAGVLDAHFPYPLGYTQNPDGTFTLEAPDGGYTWPGGGMGYSGDTPFAHVIPPPVSGDNGGANWTNLDVNESFQTWVMYVPPANGEGTVWVPLAELNWSWSASAALQAGLWTLSAGDAFHAGAFADTSDPPQWSYTNASVRQGP